jgi:MscS family membrane protein
MRQFIVFNIGTDLPGSRSWRIVLCRLLIVVVGLALWSAAPVSAQTDQAATAVDVQPADKRRSPLAPPEVGSPRQTLRSLQMYTQEATDAFTEAFALSKASGRFLDSPEIVALKNSGMANLRRAAETLDLSAVPPAARQNAGVTSALLLKEILDRIAVPDPADVPGPQDVKAGEVPAGWRLPDTTIYMVQSEGPDGNPIFRFSPETIDSLQGFYQRALELPSRLPDDLDFYVSFKTAPGLWLPISVYRFVQALPPPLQAIYWQQAAWKWVALIGLTFVLLTGIVWLVGRTYRRALSISPKRRVLRRLVTPLVLIGMLICYREIAANVVNLSGNVLYNLELTVKILVTLLGAWLIVLAFVLLGEILLASPRISRESLDGSMIRLGLKVLGIAVAAYIVTLGATQVGIPVYGIVAGIGVGGIAIALAIRPTLENLIAGIILYGDRPVRIGDFCQFGDMLGTVETIGLRSTKIRALDRTLITVQNGDFVQMQITNFTRRDSNLFNPTIGLLYETTTDQLKNIIEQSRELLMTHPQIKSESVRVTFRQYGAYALDLELWAYAIPSAWPEFLVVQEDLLMKLRIIVEQNGSGFAFPSQTTYLVSDGSADPTASV